MIWLCFFEIYIYIQPIVYTETCFLFYLHVGNKIHTKKLIKHYREAPFKNLPTFCLPSFPTKPFSVPSKLRVQLSTSHDKERRKYTLYVLHKHRAVSCFLWQAEEGKPLSVCCCWWLMFNYQEIQTLCHGTVFHFRRITGFTSTPELFFIFCVLSFFFFF